MTAAQPISLFRPLPAVAPERTDEPLAVRVRRLTEEADALTRRGFADLAARARALALEADELAKMKRGPVGCREVARQMARGLEAQGDLLGLLVEREAR